MIAYGLATYECMIMIFYMVVIVIMLNTSLYSLLIFLLDHSIKYIRFFNVCFRALFVFYLKNYCDVI